VIARADRLIAASEALQERIRDRGRTAELLTHGVDLPFWQSPATEPLPPEMLSLPRPWVVFWGLRDPRLNADWLATLARDLAHGTILLVGPSDQPPELLRSLPRVIEWPAFAFERLPALGQAADVLVMPYADLPVTRAMQPLKLKEYLATGKPVVVSDLPATRTWSDCLDVATGAAEFSSLVRERARGGVPAEQQIARRRLAAEGWSAKAGQFEQWILFGTTPSASDGNR
jgi:glycosyltransferase involved in cell wall biosynthesis